MTMMCKTLGVSRSGYYAWTRRRPSSRSQANEQLLSHIREIHEESRGTYGSPRIHAELAALGHKTGLNRVARLMHENGLRASLPKKFKRTTDSGHGLPVAENVLDRSFDPEAPDKAWATDITYIRTWEGWLHLAVVIDLYSRRVVGWSMADHMRKELALNALRMALGHRVPEQMLVHHSDRGSQYASNEYQMLLKAHGIVCSMSRKGDCYDNAVVESFFATLKKELVHRQVWPTRRSARTAIHDYVEAFYNRKRRHSHLGYRTPVEFENLFYYEGTGTEEAAA